MYKLLDNHYENLSYFVPELYENNIYDLDQDQLIQDYDRILVVKVLDYYNINNKNNNNLDFINKKNYKECFDIFLHFGSEIGILFDYYNGYIIKKIKELQDINLSYFNIYDSDKIKDYTKNYYEKYKKDYQNIFDLYYKLLDFDMDTFKYSSNIIISINNNNNIIRNNNYLTISNLDELKKTSKNIKFITIKNSIGKIHKNVLPKSLVFLNLGNSYNYEIKEGVLPQSLKYLIIGNNYNQEIKPNVLPSSLEYLVIGNNYNHKIKKDVLPQSLKYIYFGKSYTKKLNNILPESLLYLYFSKNSEYIHDIDVNTLPKSLKHVKLSGKLSYGLQQSISIRYKKINPTTKFHYTLSSDNNFDTKSKNQYTVDRDNISGFTNYYHGNILMESINNTYIDCLAEMANSHYDKINNKNNMNSYYSNNINNSYYSNNINNNNSYYDY